MDRKLNHTGNMAQSSSDAVSNVVDKEASLERESGDLLPGETLYGEARGSFEDIRVEPIFSRLKSRLTFRRKPTWIPLYELGARVDSGPGPAVRKTHWSMCINCSFFSFAFLGFLAFIGFLTGIVGFGGRSFWPDWGTQGKAGQYLAHYPTDFTRDILPVPCHSHNDYWRRIPLFEAIHYGCTSVEADVWEYGNELFVGHSISALNQNRTFRSLYVDPLVEILDRQNPSNQFGSAKNNGVFDMDAEQTLVLLVDFKTDGKALFPVVQSQIGSLRDKGYLTYFNGKDVIPGPVTVVGTGNIPFDSVIANSSYRDIFFDAPLQEFSAKSPTTSHNIYNITNSYYASASLYEVVGLPWRAQYTDDQVATFSDHINGSHMVGLKARYWDTPGWPIILRDYVWGVLVQQGVDMLNADDIFSASHGTWGKWGS